MDSTDELVQAARSGDQAAIASLLVQNLPALRAFVRLRAGAIVRAREAESDIVQSACREALESLDGFRYGGAEGFRHWLFTTTLRKILKKDRHYRAERRDVGREQATPEGMDVGELLTTYANFATPSRQVAAAEEIERIEAAFEQLSNDHREVILLSRIVGMSRREVAAALGRTEDSVRSLLHRALTSLARHLDVG
ncbi:MAG: sigma-70 family RNA polymerase sigma factor [Planctomycetota bacterium]